MSKLPYLVSEVNAALEVYLSGRTGQQYNRTAFILCDDGVELASKLFLITDDPAWSDQKGGNRFKNFWDISREVRSVFRRKRPADLGTVDALLGKMEARRTRRNDFFHSTSLLDLNFHARDCIEALCDLLDYGKLLFPTNRAQPDLDWGFVVEGTGNMETCEAILRLDLKGYSDPSVPPKINTILKSAKRLGEKPTAKGCEVVHHPEDYHLRLCVRNGGKALRDQLRLLL
jgi:hypothetical protein